MAKALKPLSPVAQSIYDLMVAQGRPLTLADVQELGLTQANSAHFVALRNRGLITSEKIDKEVVTVAVRPVNIYSVNPDAPVTE